MTTALDKIIESFTSTSMLDAVLSWLPNLVVAVLTLFIFWFLHRLARKGVGFVMARAEVDLTAVAFVQNLLQYSLFTIAAVTALGQLGVDVSSLIASLGVAGLTIGFAARDALSNVISGLFIFWDRPFVIGDLVEVDGQYGEVREITMRSTRIVTPDGRMLAIPNSTVLNSTVASYTNFPNLRLDVDVTVAVTEDIGRARQTLLAVLAGDNAYMTSPPPVVVVTALNDYNVALQLRAWLKDEKTHVRARLALREAMFEALRSAGVEMPYETLALAPVEVHQAATG